MEHNVKDWLRRRRIRLEMGIVGLLVEVVGIWVHILRGIGKEQIGNSIANASIGNGDGAWMSMNLDRRVARTGVLGREASSDQVRWVGMVITKWLDPP